MNQFPGCGKSIPAGGRIFYLRCMKKATKPIKRSIELAPLSREHHDGLLFVWKIREGLKNGTSVGKLKQYSIWFWQQHIKPHFYQEENILLPYLSPDHELAVRMKKEHEQIRELVLQLDRDADHSTFTHLANLINDHIRFEERKLFSFLEKSLSPEQLNKIYRQLEELPVCPGIWTDVFWVKK